MHGTDPHDPSPSEPTPSDLDAYADRLIAAGAVLAVVAVLCGGCGGVWGGGRQEPEPVPKKTRSSPTLAPAPGGGFYGLS